MDSIIESKLLSAFEEYKGYASNLFDCEEWAEFDAFKAGYELAISEQL